MKELYLYMASKRDEMYAAEDRTVQIDALHFIRLYKLMCDMMQIRNMVNQDEDLEEILRNIGRTE